jgi:hypothetical protein
MIQEALQSTGQAIQHHGLGALGGMAGYHAISTALSWLKTNGSLRGVWKTYIWSPKQAPLPLPFAIVEPKAIQGLQNAGIAPQYAGTTENGGTISR